MRQGSRIQKAAKGFARQSSREDSRLKRSWPRVASGESTFSSRTRTRFADCTHLFARTRLPCVLLSPRSGGCFLRHLRSPDTSCSIVGFSGQVSTRQFPTPNYQLPKEPETI